MKKIHFIISPILISINCFSQPSFTCGTSTITDYDENTYNTVQIGSQCWMKENLKTTHYPDGTALIDGICAGNTTGDTTTKYWFVYGNNMANKATYGLLYTWAATMNGGQGSSANPSVVQGICPVGWHVPSDCEWKQMEMFVGLSQTQADAIGWRGTTEGGKIKEAGTSHWLNPNTGATNVSGFTALPSGYRNFAGYFTDIGGNGLWFTATEVSSIYTLGRMLNKDVATLFRGDFFYKYDGISVRCLKDYSSSTQLPPDPPSVTPSSFCGPGTITLLAYGAYSCDEYHWYDSPTSTSILATTASFTTPLLTQTDTFWVAIYSAGIESDRVPAIATIIAISAANAGPDVIICSGNSATLSATGTGTFLWSNGATTNQITVSPLATTNYYVTVGTSQCSASDTVTVIVSDIWDVGTSNMASTIDSGLVAYYPFNGNADDLSGNNNNGTAYGAVLTTDRFGNPNSAYYFDGVDDRIFVNSSASLNVPNSISISAWFKTNDPVIHINNDNDGIIVGKHHTVWNRQYDISASEGNSIYGQADGYYFKIFNQSDNYNMTGTGIDCFYDNIWHMITGTYDSDSGIMKIFIDGVLINSLAVGMFNLEQTSVPFTIGCYLGSSTGSVLRGFFHGSIDDVRVYTRAISECEITYLYYGTDTCNGLAVELSQDTICPNTSTTVNIQNSQPVISYQLYSETNSIGNPVTGTGNTISLNTGNISVNTSFTIHATDPVSGCQRWLDTTLNVTVLNTLSVNLPDSAFISYNDSLQLNAGPGYATYLWSNTATTQTTLVYLPGEYNVTVSNAGGCQVSDSILVIYHGPTWVPDTGSNNTTGCSHTIIIPVNPNFVVVNHPLATGDYIGVFYTQNGNLVCGGVVVWQNDSTSITVYSDDPTTLIKDGFSIGEPFYWKVWESTSTTTYPAVATYVQPPAYQNTGTFVPSGLSCMQSLYANNENTQTINMNQGWNIISSFIYPYLSNMTDVMQTIVTANQLIIAKNQAGLVYWPQFTLNTIGNFNTLQGYQIKVTIQCVIYVTGIPAIPQNTPVNLGIGWFILAYLRNTPANITSMLTSISSSIIIVKNSIGHVYWPTFGLNTIGDMNPGEGYQIKTNSSCILVYPAN
ncbi:MAG: hypothetical protein NTW49_08085 [Bacteroidia bacterium]|nr:hypothetical protein [Bacteroidia bacterium]